MTSVYVPVLYLVVVIGSLVAFSFIYRRRAAGKLIEPYFPRHVERDLYVTLLGREPKAPEALLKSALIRRAVTDVQRVLNIRENKPALQALLQKGSVGDDLWNSLLAAEKEMEVEILEVMAEANSFKEGWGQFIFPTASEMVQNEKTRQTIDNFGQLRQDIVAKYGAGRKLVQLQMMPQNMTPQQIALAQAAQAAQLAQAGGLPSGTPKTPATPATPATPSTPATPATPAVNGATLTAEMTESDAESIASSPTSPRSGKKKNKRRK